jgi:pyrimidine operon attenuation protein/uracil phosphoribosyltransferase
MESNKNILLREEEMQRVIQRMAHEIVEKNGGSDALALVGIRTRGAYLARRVARRIEELTGAAPGVGIINVAGYRDDVTRQEWENPAAAVEAPVAVDEKSVVLIDDVIHTGRTVRAALDLIHRLGKPKKILVAILIDRGERELPIKADVVGKNVRVADGERVNVWLQESDGVDRVLVGGRERPPVPRG